MTISTSGSDNDQQLVDDLKNSVPEIADSIVVATIPPTPSPGLPPTVAPLVCEDGMMPIYIRRIYDYYPEEESLSLYAGPYGLGEPVFTLSYSNELQTIHGVCLPTTCYTLVMKDEHGDGWASGSSVIISTDYAEVESTTYTMPGGKEFSVVLELGGECPYTEPPTPPPTAAPTPDPTCAVFTIERVTSRLATQESVMIYVDSVENTPVWSWIGQSGVTMDVCLPYGTLYIVMTAR